MNLDLKKYFTGLDVIYRAIQYVWKATKFHTTVNIIITLLLAVIPLIPMFLMKYLLDYIAAPGKKDIEGITWIIVGFAGVQVFLIILKNVNTYNSQLLGEIVVDYMSKITIEKAIDIDFENFDSDVYHDKFQRAMAQAGAKPLTVFGTVIGFLKSIVTIFAMTGILVVLDWWIAVVLVIIAIPISLINLYYAERNIELREVQTQENRRAGYLKNMLIGGGFAKEVRAFNFGGKYIPKYIDTVRVLRRERRALYWKQARTTSVIQMLEAIVFGVIVFFIANKALKGLITVGDISLYFQAFNKGQAAVMGVMGSAISLHQHKLNLNYLFEFMDLENKIVDPINPEKIPARIKSLKTENLSFTYPGTRKEILHNVNLNFESGKITAIVGENGCGKTTLVKLINRLYDPTKGSITINDVSLSSFRLKELKAKITVIFQKFATYALTVKENIGISDTNQEFSSQKMVKSSQHAMADKFIDKLNNGYESQLGRSFKDGNELSGGQWQKVALARAFYKDSDIIILDEPSSHIDPLSEYEIFSNLKEKAKDKILILITHRIYNLKLADHIIVLDKGRVVEEGNHEQLISKAGLYAEMFEKQS